MQDDKKDFNSAVALCEKDFSHEELVSLLKNGTVIERQYGALNLDCVKNEDEAKVLLSNLVGVDGKIREVVALKIFELTKKSPDLFFPKENFETFSNATIDIDGNVCRLAIASACNLKNNEDFSIYYAESMIKIIETALDEISKFTFRDKKYKINKQIFKIYWCLEALIDFYPFVKENELQDILEKCSDLQEYTVREKCAKILCHCRLNSDMQILFDKLKNDENYYVRSVFEENSNN